MGRHERVERDQPQSLPVRFVAMCIEQWVRRGGDRTVLAAAMLAGSVIEMLVEDEPEEVAHVLRGLASAISAQPEQKTCLDFPLHAPAKCLTNAFRTSRNPTGGRCGAAEHGNE